MKRTLAAAAMMALLAGSAQAQFAQSWTSYQSGSQRNYTGYDQNGGAWTGTSYQSGSQRNSTFYGPDGQSTRCTSYQMGSQTNTQCY